jgi:protein-L-isoaspartate(D-aspartate) O-methyltransferase
VTIPDADRPDIDPAELASALAGPPVPVPTGIHAATARVAWGLGLWLAATEPRLCQVYEELPAEPGDATRLTRAPLRGRGALVTVGIVDPGGIAVLTAMPPDGDELVPDAIGFGPNASTLAADLAALVQAWDRAGQPGTTGLHVDAYPRSGHGPTAPPAGALLIERPGTDFIVYRQVA